MPKFLLFFCLFLGLSNTSEAYLPLQTAEENLAPLHFSDEILEELQQDPDFDYSEVQADENWWTKFKKYINLQWQRFLSWLFGEYEAPYLLQLFLKILPYLLLGLLMGLILYLFSKLNPNFYVSKTGKEPLVHLNEEEKLVKNTDISLLIKKAISEENFRLAIRYHFLLVLQQLTRADIIDYNSSKTDEDYLLEINNSNLKSQFEKSNRIYDFVWYGHFEPSEQDYKGLKPAFEKIENLVNLPHEQNL